MFHISNKQIEGKRINQNTKDLVVILLAACCIGMTVGCASKTESTSQETETVTYDNSEIEDSETKGQLEQDSENAEDSSNVSQDTVQTIENLDDILIEAVRNYESPLSIKEYSYSAKMWELETGDFTDDIILSDKPDTEVIYDRKNHICYADIIGEPNGYFTEDYAYIREDNNGWVKVNNENYGERITSYLVLPDIFVRDYSGISYSEKEDKFKIQYERNDNITINGKAYYGILATGNAGLTHGSYSDEEYMAYLIDKDSLVAEYRIEYMPYSIWITSCIVGDIPDLILSEDIINAKAESESAPDDALLSSFQDSIRKYMLNKYRAIAYNISYETEMWNLNLDDWKNITVQDADMILKYDAVNKVSYNRMMGSEMYLDSDWMYSKDENESSWLKIDIKQMGDSGIYSMDTEKYSQQQLEELYDAEINENKTDYPAYDFCLINGREYYGVQSTTEMDRTHMYENSYASFTVYYIDKNTMEVIYVLTYAMYGSMLEKTIFTETLSLVIPDEAIHAMEYSY